MTSIARQAVLVLTVFSDVVQGHMVTNAGMAVVRAVDRASSAVVALKIATSDLPPSPIDTTIEQLIVSKVSPARKYVFLCGGCPYQLTGDVVCSLEFWILDSIMVSPILSPSCATSVL